MRDVRRKYSRTLREVSAEAVIEIAQALHAKPGLRWIGYELIRNHATAFACVDTRMLEELGRDMNSWWSVDQFARILSGPAWEAGQVPDRAIARWARSKNPWWRRAALVSTVELSDDKRVLAICRALVSDREDLVVKALSWALRALARHDSAAVRAFLEKHRDALAARVKREVGVKFTRSGSAAPKRSRR
jgi:3-methyladenine DNA glycosylase AlkD